MGDLYPLARMVSLSSASLEVMAPLTARALSITFVMDPAWCPLMWGHITYNIYNMIYIYIIIIYTYI